MGTSFSNESHSIRAKNAAINRDLKNQKKTRQKEKRVLFLGAGGSGKSTIYRQINYIHGSKSFDEQDREWYRTVIQSNVFKGLQKMIFMLKHEEAMGSSCDLPPEVEELESCCPIDLNGNHNNDMEHEKRNASLLMKHGDAAIKSWRCHTMSLFWCSQPNSRIESSLDHFLNQIETIVREDYMPSGIDILHTRVKTTSIVETQLNIHNKQFRFIDVGGQRNERRKWIHCFQDVNCVVFVVSLTSYAERCVEDNRTNRLREALSVFEETIVSSGWFESSAIVLFLNKSDLLVKYLQRGFVPDDTVMELPVGVTHWDYDTVVEEMARMFQNKTAASPHRCSNMSHYVLCALDTNLVENVFEAVQYDIFERQITSKGLL